MRAAAVQVGMSGPVSGLLPSGWKLEAQFDGESGLLELSSPDTDRLRIIVDTNKMDEYSDEHKPTSDQLDEKSRVEAKYESGVLRFTSPDHPEFWIEVHVKRLPEVLCTKRKRSNEVNDDDERTRYDDETMQWFKIYVDDAVLTLWPGTRVRKADLDGPKSIHVFFKKMFNIEVVPVGCVETLPDIDASGQNIDGTGGRHDFFFFVKVADVPRFAVKRFQFGMRWWSDVHSNNGEGIYPSEFLEAYPGTA